jgi:hypothetical protein
MIKRNLANWERAARVAAGAAVATAGFFFFDSVGMQALVALSGLGFAVTGAAARCPVCHVAGVASYRDPA